MGSPKTVLFALLATASFFSLSGCGFAPVYGTYADAAAARDSAPEESLTGIDIGIIPDRDGQVLRNHLIDRFYAGSGLSANPLYRLDIAEIQETRTELAITKTAETTRAQMRLKTKLKLTEISTGKAVLSRDLHAIAGFNVLGSEFATRVAEQGARDSALADLARQIELQVSLFLNRGSDPTDVKP
jgi:LPS-assembly lipoprotein